MYPLVATAYFERRLRRFRRMHPELGERLTRLFRDLQDDPSQPQLRLHPLQGDLAGLHAVSLTQAYRILLRFRIQEHEIILIDIGSHDEVYR